MENDRVIFFNQNKAHQNWTSLTLLTRLIQSGYSASSSKFDLSKHAHDLDQQMIKSQAERSILSFATALPDCSKNYITEEQCISFQEVETLS